MVDLAKLDETDHWMLMCMKSVAMIVNSLNVLPHLDALPHTSRCIIFLVLSVLNGHLARIHFYLISYLLTALIQTRDSSATLS